MFTINGVEHSVSVKHNLTEDKCSLSGVLLTDRITENPPYKVELYNDNLTNKLVLVGSKPYYICLPTNLVGLD